MDEREVAVKQRHVVHVAARTEAREAVLVLQPVFLAPRHANGPDIRHRIAERGRPRVPFEQFEQLALLRIAPGLAPGGGIFPFLNEQPRDRAVANQIAHGLRRGLSRSVEQQIRPRIAGGERRHGAAPIIEPHPVYQRMQRPGFARRERDRFSVFSRLAGPRGELRRQGEEPGGIDLEREPGA